MNDRSQGCVRVARGLGGAALAMGLLLGAGCESTSPRMLELGDLAAAGGSDLGGGGGGDLAMAEQPPPEPSLAAVESFLNQGLYKGWKCEPRPVTRTDGLPRAHGATNRICNNSAIADTAGTPFPVSAMSVKELYNTAGTQITGYAVAIRLATGDGGSNRYWYEKNNGSLYADGQGVGLCVGCHSSAPRDYVYVVAK